MVVRRRSHVAATGIALPVYTLILAEPTISSTLARGVVERLRFDARYTYDPLRPELFANDEAGRNMILNPAGYRLWVRERLRESGLEKLLPGGAGTLPDIFENFPWLRSAAFLVRPRDYAGLAEHLARYLDWYLDPARELRSSRLVLDLIQSRYGCAFSLMLFTLYAFLPQMFEKTGAVLLAYIPMTLLFLGLLHLYRSAGGNEYLLHKEELYFFLREAYSDPAEDEGATASPPGPKPDLSP